MRINKCGCGCCCELRVLGGRCRPEQLGLASLGEERECPSLQQRRAQMFLRGGACLDLTRAFLGLLDAALKAAERECNHNR